MCLVPSGVGEVASDLWRGPSLILEVTSPIVAQCEPVVKLTLKAVKSLYPSQWSKLSRTILSSQEEKITQNGTKVIKIEIQGTS